MNVMELPFAGVARAAFVAMQLLNSLVEIDFITKEEKDDFLNSLNTVSKNLRNKQTIFPSFFECDEIFSFYNHSIIPNFITQNILHLPM